MWLILLFIHAFALAGFNLSLRKSLINKADPFTLATIMQTGITVPMIFLIIIKPPSFDTYRAIDFIILTAATLLPIALHVANVNALKYLETSVYSLIYNLRLLIVTVLGILFLNEQAVWLRISGGILILLAIIIVHQKGSHSAKIKGIKWGIIAAFTISFLNITEKFMITTIGIINYLPVSVIAASIIMWAILIYRRKSNIELSLLLQPRMLQLMTFRAISAYSFILALAAGAFVSVANYVSGLSVIIMVVLGALLLGERDYLLRKAVATTLAILGLTMILISDLVS